MFQALKERFSKDDDAKAERKALSAETVAKRRELKLGARSSAMRTLRQHREHMAEQSVRDERRRLGRDEKQVG